MFSRWLWLLEEGNLLPPPLFTCGKRLLTIEFLSSSKNGILSLLHFPAFLKPRPPPQAGRSLEVAPQETTQMRPLQMMLINISSPPFDLQAKNNETNNALVAKLLLDLCFPTDEALSQNVLEEKPSKHTRICCYQLLLFFFVTNP